MKIRGLAHLICTFRLSHSPKSISLLKTGAFQKRLNLSIFKAEQCHTSPLLKKHLQSRMKRKKLKIDFHSQAVPQ